MNYYNTVPFVLVDDLEVSICQNCVRVIPHSRLVDVNLDQLIQIQSKSLFVVYNDCPDKEIDALILFSENYLKIDEEPFIFKSIDMNKVDLSFSDELFFEQLNEIDLNPLFYTSGKEDFHPRVSLESKYATAFKIIDQLHELRKSSDKKENQIQILNDSLKANKTESQKEIEFYKSEMVKRENWAKKNPDMNAWEVFKLLLKRMLGR